MASPLSCLVVPAWTEPEDFHGRNTKDGHGYRPALADAGLAELTGAWQGDDTGAYYIRQVGDCIWWFGTELEDIESGLTGQPGFANVAGGRVDGTHIEVEWADLPAGDVLGGGGLTLVYDEEHDQLLITEQRGDWETYGATMFTRIEPGASPDASPSESLGLPGSRRHRRPGRGWSPGD